MKSNNNSDYGTIVNCLDGTVQLPAIDFAKKLWKVNRVDVITEAAPEKILSETKDRETIERICKNIEASICDQHTKRLAIVSHSNCDINNVSDTNKKDMLSKAIGYLKARFIDIEIVGIWFDGNIKATKIEI